MANDWQGLDRFPGWTMQEVNPAVGVINKVVTKHPETPVGTPSGAPTEAAVKCRQGSDYGVSRPGELFAGEGGDGEPG